MGKGTIRSLEFDLFKNYVFTGGFDDGEICVFNIEKPGKEKFAKQAASFKGKPKVLIFGIIYFFPKNLVLFYMVF